jgi:hypothetical protein
MGPGTHVRDRISRGVLPTTYTDAAALFHDLRYLHAQSESELHPADDIAIREAPVFSLQGQVMKVGLGLRDKLHLPLYGSKPILAEQLFDKVINDPSYVSRFKELGYSVPSGLH